MKKEIVIRKPEVRKSKCVRLSDINTGFIEKLSQENTASFSDALNAVIEYARFKAIQNKKDKRGIVFECMETNNFNIDDLAKLLCCMFKRMCDEVEMPQSDIQKVFYCEGKKFTLKIEMTPHEI